jgi:hypothetical protein
VTATTHKVSRMTNRTGTKSPLAFVTAMGFIAAAVSAAVSVVPSLPALSIPPSVRTPVDVTDPAAVTGYHRTYYQQAPTPAPGWTGSAASCTPGSLDPSYLDAALQRVVYFRNLAGSTTDTIDLDAVQNTSAQVGALLMAVNDDIDHYPNSGTFPACWTEVGAAAADAAAKSNLAWSKGWGMGLASTVDGWIADDGVPSAGHRWWALHPNATDIGFGEAQSGSTVTALQRLPLETMVYPWSIASRTNGVLAWPTCGTAAAPAYTSWETAYPLFSLDKYGANWATAAVSVTRNGATVPAPVTSRGAGNGWPFTFLVNNGTITRPVSDGNPATFDYDEYVITVTGATGAGLPSPLSCVVRVLDVNLAPTAPTTTLFTTAENRFTSFIATLDAGNPDEDTLTYSLTTGCASGSSGNAAVTISGSSLHAASAYDFEAASSYTACIEVTDGRDDGSVMFNITVDVTNVNEPPSAVSLSSSSVDLANGNTLVGRLTGVDPDAGDALTFTAAVPFTSTPPFIVVGDELHVAAGTRTGTYQVTVTARDAAGLMLQAPFTITVLDSTPSSARLFAGSTPTRLVDTRAQYGAFPRGVLRGTDTLTLDVGGTRPVALNLTAAFPTAPGYLGLYPCADGYPGTSSINFVPGETVANMALATPDEDGLVCVHAYVPGGEVHVVIDRFGDFNAASGFTGTPPQRRFDSRDGHGKLAAGATYVLGGLAPGRGAILNLTVTEPEAPGFLTAYPCAAGRPNASSNNYQPRQTHAAMTVVVADAEGKVCVYTLAPTHLVIDEFGSITTDQAEFVTPVRVLETRASGRIGQFAKGNGFSVNFPASKGRAVVINVTATNTEAPGFVTAWPCSEPLPTASILNYAAAGTTVPNSVVIQPDSHGFVCFWSHAPTDLVIDLQGYLNR